MDSVLGKFGCCMMFHNNCLLANDSHGISSLIFFSKIEKNVKKKKLSSRVKVL